MFVRQMFFRLNFRLSRCVLTTASNISCQCHKYQISPTFLSHSLKHHYICISDGSNNRYVSESHIPRQLSLALLFFSSAENFTYLSTLFKSASTMYSAAVYHHGKPSCAWVAPQQEIHHQTAKTKSRPTSALPKHQTDWAILPWRAQYQHQSMFRVRLKLLKPISPQPYMSYTFTTSATTYTQTLRRPKPAQEPGRKQTP